MNIRKANADDLNHLNNLAFRSKAYWGYDEAFMVEAIEDLFLNPRNIENGMVYLAEDQGKIIGYYAFCEDNIPEMIALFVEPNRIGTGVGLKLWQHSIKFAANQGWNNFKIIADPFAAKKFYLKVGCKQIGEFQSPVRKDRKIPLLQYSLAEGSSKVQILYHVSENPDIQEFVPQPPPNKDAGIEFNAVWTISESELANYLLPRDCPRICYRNKDQKKVIAIELGWKNRIEQTKLYIYCFESTNFIQIDPVAGYWISRVAVKPSSTIEVENLLQKLSDMEVVLKFLPHLHEERKMVMENHKQFSIIRFRNAQSPY